MTKQDIDTSESFSSWIWWLRPLWNCPQTPAWTRCTFLGLYCNISTVNVLYWCGETRILSNLWSVLASAPEQSGTKPNLLKKIWPPTLLTICAGLPKLVANVSSGFHHLVNTGLTVGSFVKWLPIMVYGPCMIVPHKWTKICWLATAN